jgi:hypothetical protein
VTAGSLWRGRGHTASVLFIRIPHDLCTNVPLCIFAEGCGLGKRGSTSICSGVDKFLGESTRRWEMANNIVETSPSSTVSTAH